MRRNYTMLTLRLILIGMIGLGLTGLIGCGGAGSPGGGDRLGATASIALSSGTDTLPSDGVSSTSITTTLTDSSGAAVDQYTAVKFTTDLGSFRNGLTEITTETPDESGTVTVPFMAGTVWGTAHITIESNGVKQLLEITITEDLPVAQVALSPSPDRIYPQGIVNINAVVTNTNGNTMADETVLFSVVTNASGGKLNSVTATTDANGEASVTYTAGSIQGSDILKATATSNSVFGTATLTVDPDAVTVNSITLTSGAETIYGDGVSQAVIRATVKGPNDASISDIDVTFITTLGTFVGSGSTTATVSTDENGVAQVTLQAGTSLGTANVTGSAGGFSGNVNVGITEPPRQPAFLSLNPSQTTVKTDNTDSATITASVLDANRVPIEGVVVSFTTIAEDGVSTAGQISASNVETDVSGEASVIFKSGAEKKNQLVNIKATVSGISAKQIPIQVTGTYITLSTNGSTGIEIGGDAVTLVATVKDAGGSPIFDKLVLFSIDPDYPDPPASQGDVEFSSSSPKATIGENGSSANDYTDVNGQVTITINAKAAGDVKVNVASLGASASQDYSVGDPGNVFKITDPLLGDAVYDKDNDGIFSLSTNEPLSITVRSPGDKPVTFATTFGSWNGTTAKVIPVITAGELATATLRSDEAGTATVQVYATDDPSFSDTITVDISAPPSEASQIIIQAPANIAPSTTDVKNSVDVRAIVKNINDQVVGGAAVTFFIENPTGGGETISPAVVYTDSSGAATATFTSGDLVGSDPNGVTIVAQIVDTSIQAHTFIIITGTAASVSIGSSTQIEAFNNNTMYRLPMSVKVTDSNGSPLANARISLNLWPAGYLKGFWVEVQPSVCRISYSPAQVFENEDVNKNLILDTGEDLNEDGRLSPSSSSAGSVVPEVTTDASGNAAFNLEYLKEFSGWIQAQLTVTTPNVLGTEIRAVKTFILPWQAGEECSLPHSPFNTDGIEPTISSVTVEAAGESIVADNESTIKIEATLLDSNGALLEGEDVKLFTSLGTFVSTDTGSATVTTNVSGVAEATLRSGFTMGTATITAIAGGISTTTTVALVAGPPSNISLALGSDTASLGETITLTATVIDKDGHAVINEPVIFSVDPNESNGLLSALTVTTDVNGNASVNYVAGGTRGQDVIRAKLANNEALNDSKSLTVSDGIIEPVEMLIEALPTVIDANGSSSAEIHVLLRDANNNPVKKADVNFSTDLGTVTGTATTGDDGFAYVGGVTGTWPVLVSEKRNGVATVTAWYGPSASPLATITTSVSFSGAVLAITATPESLSTGEQTMIQTTLKGSSGAPFVDTDVVIETDLGNFVDGDGNNLEDDDGNVLTSYTAKTDTNGNVSVWLSSSTGGTATVTAWHAVTRGKPGETTAATSVVISGNRLTITPAATSLVADGAGFTTVIVKLEGDAGPVASQDISLSTTLGSIDSTVTTNASGEANATLTAGNVIGVAVISASAELSGGTLISATKDVPFTSGAVSSIEMIIDPSIIKVNTGTSDIRVVVKDVNGNPVGNAPVAFTLIAGPGGGETITPATVRTAGPGSANPGQAFAVFTAGSLGSSNSEDVKIEASVGGIVTSANLTISGSPSNISLGTTTSSVTDNKDGTYSIPVSAMVSDVSGISVPAGYVVTFSTDNPELGSFVSPKQTNDTGKATSFLTYPSTKVGEVIKIIANSVGVTAQESVTLPALSANVVTEVRAEAPTAILGDGVNDVEVRAQAVESDGEYADFTVSYFQTSSTNSPFDPENPSGNITGATYWGGGETRANFTATPGPDTDPGDPFVSQDYTAYIRATAGGGIHSQILPILIKGISLTVTPSSTSLLANGTSTTTLTAVVKETTTGLPVASAELNFGVTNGIVSGFAFTDNSGTATVTYTSIESDVDKTASIRVYYGPDIVATNDIELKASADVAQILVSSDTDTLFNDPTEMAVITAQVLDADGHPVPDGQKVTFDITSGPGQVESSAVTLNGVAQAEFRATPTIGTATVTVTSGVESATLDIDIIAHRVGSLTLVAGANSILADGTSEVAVRATVNDTDENPLPGVNVNFSSTLGTITTANPATTDAQGIAEIRLKSGTKAGTATITAVIEGFARTVTIGFNADAPDATRSSIGAAPAALNPGGTTIVTITVLDANDNPVSDEAVNFSVTANNSGGALLSSTGTTDSGGTTSVIYASGSGAGTDTVTAVATSNGASVSVDITVNAGTTVVGSIALSTGAASLVADNSSNATIRATVLNTAGNPAAGVDVDFSTTLGSITTAMPVTTDNNGIAEVTFETGITAGTATITAEASGFIATIGINLVAGPPTGVIVKASPTTLNPTDTATIGATVTDANTNPVNNETIYFLVSANNSGGNLSAVSAVTDINGQASVTYAAGSTTGVVDKITARTASNGVSGNEVSLNVDAAAIVVGGVALSSGSGSIAADGSSTNLRAVVTDTGGNPASGIDVKFTTTLGTLTGGGATVTVTTNVNGIAETTLTSGVIIGTATIKAEASGFVTLLNVAFVAGAPASLTMAASPNTLNPGLATTVMATVTDGANPVVGETVNFNVSTNTSGGSLSSLSATTNVNGQASVTFTAGSTSGGDDTITGTVASKTTVTGDVSITVDAAAVVVESMTLTSGAGQLVADGAKKATIRATVLDTAGNPAPGIDVDFETSLGTLTGGGQTATVTTNANGVAELTLTSGTAVGTAKITADASGFVKSIDVTLVAGTPTLVTISSAPGTVNPGGTAAITANVTDSNLNPVIGETVNFAFDTNVSGASLSVLSAVTDVNGHAVVTYTAGDTEGTDKIGAAAASNGLAAVTPASVIVSSQAQVVGGITLIAGSASIVADGTSQVTIRANLTDTNGDPIASKTVKFETTAGTLSASTNDTDADGNAEILLTAPESTGIVTVRAIADGFAQTVDVNAIAGEADHFIYYVAPQTVNPGGTFHIDAFLEDDHDNRLTSQFVTFIIKKHSDSTIVETRGDTTAADNVIRMDFSALWGEEDLDVTLESTNGKTATFTVTVDAAATVVGSVSLTSGSASIVADTNHDTVIRATVLDSAGAAASGVTVDFTTTLGTLTGGLQTASGTSNDAGIVEITLTGVTTAGIATVTAQASGFASTTNVAFIAGVPAAVTISAAPGTVNPAGISTVTARVTDISGNPIVGETVGFYIDPALNNSGGLLSAVSAVTNVNGVANVTFTAGGDTGTDTIRATAQSNGTSNTKDITVGYQAQVVGSVTVVTGAASLPADESSSTTIRATVTDTSGNPMAGVTVNFTTTSGSLSAATDDTDANGIAEITLTAPANTGTGSVTAEYNGFTGTASITFSAGPADHIILYATPDTVRPGGAFQIAAIVLDAKDNRLSNERVTIIITENGSADVLDTTEQVTDADGVLRVDAAAAYGSNDLDITAQTSNGTSKTITVNVDLTAVVVGAVSLSSGATTLVSNGSTTIIRATVTDTSGALAEGVDVTFETTAGSITPGPVATNSSGIAEATLTSSTNAGTANITAVASGFRTSITVTFVAGVPETVSVSAAPGNLTADGTSTSTVNIIVLDANGNPVNGETLTISVDEGTLNSLVTTTVNGLASATYTSPNSVPADGRGTITVETANGKSGTTDITLIGQQIASITLSASPTSLPADGSSPAVISATLTLVGGGAVPDGTTVDFTIADTDGNNNDQITAQASTSTGVALATLISDDIQGTATIQATAGGRTAQIQIEYTPGSISLLVVPNSILGTGGKTAAITVTVLNAAGAPLDNEAVNVALDDLSLGTVSPASTSTDATGKASFLFTGAAKGGTVTITASYDPDIPDNPGNDNDVSGTATIDIQEPPAFIEVADGYPNPTSINIKGTGGQSTSQLIFDVKDIAGDPVADGYRVDFAILSGPNGNEAIEPSTTTTSGGQIATILRSGTKSGPVSIKATYYNNTNISTTTSQIAINAGPPVGEEFGVFAKFVNVSGLWVANLEDQISVNVGDIYGNAVPDGTAISFKTYNTGGFFSPNTAATTEGLASNSLHSGGTSPQPLNGFLTVTAEANNGGRTTHVTSIAVNPDDNNIMYVGTDGGGVYKSTDAGSSWINVSRSSSSVSRNFIDPYVNGISVDPDDSNVVYAATGYLGGGHIYRSLDGGGSWNSNDPEEWNGVLSVGSSVQSVLCDDGTSYVWAGTNGQGALFAADGETFQWGGTSTGPVAGVNVGTGVMSTPTLGVTAITEDWSATYAKNGATASTPIFTGSASASMSGLSATSTAQNEGWTVTYTGGFGAVTYHNDGGGTATSSDLTVVTTYIGTLSEDWTVTCTNDDITAGPEKFRVVGSRSGLQDEEAENGKNFIATGQNGNVVKFFIVGKGFVVNDNFTFSTTADGWSVTGTGSGAQTAARTGVAYTSDSSEISFTISEPTGQFFEKGDTFTFTTTITGEWIVAGTVSGAQSNRAENGTTYTSDNEEVSFSISQGGTAFEPGDSFTFSITGSGLGYGKLVRKIVRASGTGATATLYAATATGVYKTINGGQIWTRSDFPGDNIQALIVHPSHSTVIYAGTADNGVYYSDDSGATWQAATSTGLGQGLSATDPATDSNNTGNGVMSEVEVFPGYANTKTENWTVACTAAAVDGGTFSVTGSVSGLQAAYDITSGTYTIAGVLSFTLTDGSTDFAVGDTFTFSTTRDPGTNIKDLLVYDDGAGYYLYAVTNFNGELEPHAVGNIYGLALVGGTGAPAGGASWATASTGLPAYDPPGDETLFAQYALATNDPATPTALFVGGEGINFYKATGAAALTAGTPSWVESKSGLTNTIMARMPILFSGACSMNIYNVERTGDVVTYTVYIQDSNGNPPIKDSNFNVIRKLGDDATTLVDITYSDGYTHTGTWSDPSDPDTNNPYIFSTAVDDGVKVIFTFTPACSTEAPGCSGGTQSSTLTY